MNSSDIWARDDGPPRLSEASLLFGYKLGLDGRNKTDFFRRAYSRLLHSITRQEIALFFFRQRLHTAACAMAAAWGWSKLLRVGLNGWPLLVVPITVVCVYQWNRLTDTREDLLNCPEDAQDAIRTAGKIRYFCIFSLVAVLAILVSVGNLKSDLVIFFCFLLGYLYCNQIGTPHGSSRLKQITLLKNISSALGWSLLTILYPAMNANQAVGFQTLLVFSIMFTAVSVVELTWDIRDITGDEVAGIRSIPVVYGIKFTEGCIFVMNCLGGVLVIVGLQYGCLMTAWVFIVLNACLMLISVVRVHCTDKVDRTWSNAMVLLQSAMLLGIGLSSR